MTTSRNCLFNRYIGASKGIERAATNLGQMSAEVQAALPGAITAWQGIGTNIDGLTANINRLTKPGWYGRLLGYGLNGVVIYRNLNYYQHHSQGRTDRFVASVNASEIDRAVFLTGEPAITIEIKMDG